MERQSDVELRLPAETAYVAVLRMTTAGLAARLDFTLDDIEDLRMAVGEACALVLGDAVPGSELVAGFDLGETALRVSISATGIVEPGDPGAPDDGTRTIEPGADGLDGGDTFGWQVLTALATDVTLSSDGPRRTVSFTVRSSIAA